MFEITIHLKTGNKFSFFVNEFTVKRTATGAFSSIEWANGDEKQEQLMYVNVDDISAITSRPTSFAADTHHAQAGANQSDNQGQV